MKNNYSYNCNYSYDCDYSNNCDHSYDCNYSDNCDHSHNCDYSYNCNYSHNCDHSNNCDYSDNCYYSHDCNYSYDCYYSHDCYYSKGLRMSENMLFCFGEEKYSKKGIGYQNDYMIFNQVEKEEWNAIYNSMPTISLRLTKWIDKDKMTKEEKENINIWEDTGGYLKIFTYTEAWQNWINQASQRDINKILNCKYYDAEIFKKITGCELKKDDEVDITVEGVVKRISRKSAIVLGLLDK